MNKKSLCIQLTCLVIGLFFTTIAFTQDAETKKQNWLLGVVFKLEKMRDDAVVKIRNADTQIRNAKNMIRKAEKLIKLSIEEGDSEAEGIARQALATAQNAKAKAQEIKTIAELRKLRAEKSIARVRNLLAKLVSVDVEVKSVVSNYSGKVVYSSRKENEWIPLEKDRAGYLEAGDTIRTGHNGKAEVYFLDGEGVIRLGPNSCFRLEEDKSGEQTIEFLKGNIQFEAERPFKVHTPTVAVAVRGTQFLLSEVEGKGTEVIVFEGSIELSDLKGRKTVIVSAGYKAEVPVNGIPLEPYKVDLTKIEKWWEETEGNSVAMEWEGQYSSQQEPFAQIVTSEWGSRNSLGWRDLWKKVSTSSKASAIDFDKYVVACVFLGRRPTGGYWVEFGKPYIKDNRMMIPYREHKPTGFVTQALSYPYRIKVFERPAGREVVLQRIQ